MEVRDFSAYLLKVRAGVYCTGDACADACAPKGGASVLVNRNLCGTRLQRYDIFPGGPQTGLKIHNF